jgi:predicted ATPase
MLLLTQLDRRGEALNTYRRLVTRLQHNYDSEPLPETRELYEKLRQGHSIKASQAKLLIAKSVNERENATYENPSLLAIPPQTQSMPAASDKTLPHIFTPFVSTSQLGRYNQSPLIGRVKELDTIRHILHSIQEISHEALLSNTGDGHSVPAGKMRKPHVLLLMGEAGIGKTRLAEELSHEAKTHGWAVAWTRAYEQEGTVPYRPWIELLRTLLKHIPTEVLVSNVGVKPNEEAFTNIPYTPTNLERLSTLLPELRDILPPNERTYPQLPPEQERLHLWEATLGLLSTLSKTSPLLLVLDDLHWTDGSSRELLAYLTRHMQDQRILLLATCRDVELAPGHGLRSLIADLRREQTLYTLAIQPLTQAQIGSLVAHLPQNIVQSIQSQAAGNPFFAEELARVSESIQAVSPRAHYSEQGMLAHTSTHHNEGERDVSPSGSTLPEGITAVLDRRLSCLSSECQALLGKASVLGGSFEFSQLLFMANEHHEDTILDLLEEALRAGLLTEEGAGARITYHFWHPLIVNHLYERLSAARCAQLHRRAANALLHTYQGHEEEVAPVIT